MEADEDVCFRHKADILTRSINVRFRGQSGHSADLSPCPLMTPNGNFAVSESNLVVELSLTRKW